MRDHTTLPVRVLLSAVAVIVFVFSIFPVYWMLNSALLPTSAVQDSTPHFWPDEFTLRNFVTVVTEPSGSIEFVPALTTSLIVTVSTVVFALFFAFFAALALTRFRFKSRRT
ncbi:MAG: carbohydrate ABC transporter permease, partial [Leifsonia sp.]